MLNYVKKKKIKHVFLYRLKNGYIFHSVYFFYSNNIYCLFKNIQIQFLVIIKIIKKMHLANFQIKAINLNFTMVMEIDSLNFDLQMLFCFVKKKFFKYFFQEETLSKRPSKFLQRIYLNLSKKIILTVFSKYSS